MFKTFINKETGEFAKFIYDGRYYLARWEITNIPELFDIDITLDDIVRNNHLPYNFFDGYDLIEVKLEKI